MSEETKKSLSVENFIERLYEFLNGAIGEMELDLPEEVKVTAEVDRSAEPHRTDYGHMYYDSVVLADINGKEWILAHGKPGQNHVMRDCNGDILLGDYSWRRKGEEQLIEEIPRFLKEECTYFSNTLLYGKRNEVLEFPDYSRIFGRLMKELLIQRISELSPQEDVRASFSERNGMSLRVWKEQSDYPRSSAKYGEEIELKPKSAGFLTSVIEKTFRD